MDKFRPWRYHPYIDPWMESSDEEWNSIALRDIDSYTLDHMMQNYPMTKQSVERFIDYELKMPILKSPLSYHGRLEPASGFRFQMYMNPKFFEKDCNKEDRSITFMHEVAHGFYRAMGSVVHSVMGMVYATNCMKEDFEEFDGNTQKAQQLVLECYTRENLIEECAKEFYNSNKEFVDNIVDRLMGGSEYASCGNSKKEVS